MSQSIIYFSPIREALPGDLLLCSSCGAAIVDEFKHRRWHDENDRPF